MTLTDLGINYICYNFGDASHCCVKTGLSWYYTVGTTNYNETGATAQIVSRLASGLVNSLTMTTPARGTFTQTQLNTANGQAVTLQDAQTITLHDESTEQQWCFIACSAHTTAADCVYFGCYWYNGACHDTAPACSALNNQTDCAAYSCYWWNGACHSSAPTCEQINTQTECLAWSCFWYNNSCHSTLVCSAITTQTDCTAHGCYWYNGSCHATAPACTDLNNSTDCLAYNCKWWNGSCHSAAPTCPQLNNQSDCQAWGCYWYRNACHSSDQPQLCYWLDSKGGATGLDITEVFQIIDSYVLQTPPTGYTFIPTVIQVFGVIDYYLGFITSGNSETGCAY